MQNVNVKGTETEKNLREAFAAEAQARVKYEYFASKARRDGYEQIADIFDETAKNEREHAEIWFKLLRDGATPPTLAALKESADIENYEWSNLYAQFADRARAEGLEPIAVLFDQVGAIEQEHENRFRKLVANIEGGLVFSRDSDRIWQCANCGHIVIGRQAPEVCPVCSHSRAFFQIKAENY